MDLPINDDQQKLGVLAELIKLASEEFIKAMTDIGNALKLDIEKLTVSQKLKDQEIISNFDRQLNFLEDFNNDNELSEEMKKEIYNDFNEVATRLEGYQIRVYNDTQKEKLTKQVLDGILKVVTVAAIGHFFVALIKKIK